MFGGTADDYWGGHSEDDARDLIAAALEYGVTYLDVAEAYNDGRSEEALGRILGNRRSEAVIGTKVLPQNCAPDTLREHCEASLKRLDTDYIDLYYVHWPIRDTPLEDSMATLQKLKDEGKIRAICVSNYGVLDLGEALATGVQIDANQMHYNLLSRGIEIGVQPLCSEKNIAIVGYMPLLQGILTGKFKSIDEIPPNRTRTRHFRSDRQESRHGTPGAEAEVQEALTGIRKVADDLGVSMAELALGWTVAKPGITCTLAGARNTDQLRANIAGVTLDLSADVVARLNEVTNPLLEKLGPSPDYWQSGENSRIR
jgi:aryl-alcohol dehydrogenase-like predicted oxidoreductase